MFTYHFQKEASKFIGEITMVEKKYTLKIEKKIHVKKQQMLLYRFIPYHNVSEIIIQFATKYIQ